METQEQYRTSNIRWASIDPSKSSTGVALWNGPDLIHAITVKPYGGSGKYKVGNTMTGHEIYPDKLGAFRFTTMGAEKVIIEEGFGRFSTAVKSQGEMRGYIECVCHVRGLPSPTVINVSEWRRICKEQFAVSWPKESKRCKALAIKLVKQHFGVEVSEDEADAVLVGYAAQRAGMV